MMYEETGATQDCCAPGIRDDLEKTLARMNGLRSSFREILDSLDGPQPEPDRAFPDRGPNNPNNSGLASIRTQIAELNIVISQLEDERDRLSRVRHTLLGDLPSVLVGSDKPANCEIRQGDWRSHP